VTAQPGVLKEAQITLAKALLKDFPFRKLVFAPLAREKDKSEKSLRTKREAQ